MPPCIEGMQDARLVSNHVVWNVPHLPDTILFLRDNTDRCTTHEAKREHDFDLRLRHERPQVCTLYVHVYIREQNTCMFCVY